MGVLELGRDPDFAQEPLGAEQGGQLGAENLQRHTAVVPEVLGQVNCGHAPMAKLAKDRVALGEGRRQAVELRHRGLRRRRIQSAGELSFVSYDRSGARFELHVATQHLRSLDEPDLS
jgi:hypothetical protein